MLHFPFWIHAQYFWEDFRGYAVVCILSLRQEWSDWTIILKNGAWQEDFCCASYVSFIVIVCARKELGCSYWRISIIGTLTNTCKEKKNSRLSFTISNASPPAAFATHLMQNCFKWLWWVLVFLTRDKCDRWEIRVATENARAEDEDNGSLLRSTKGQTQQQNRQYTLSCHFLP